MANVMSTYTYMVLNRIYRCDVRRNCFYFMYYTRFEITSKYNFESNTVGNMYPRSIRYIVLMHAERINYSNNSKFVGEQNGFTTYNIIYMFMY